MCICTIKPIGIGSGGLDSDGLAQLHCVISLWLKFLLEKKKKKIPQNRKRGLKSFTQCHGHGFCYGLISSNLLLIRNFSFFFFFFSPSSLLRFRLYLPPSLLPEVTDTLPSHSRNSASERPLRLCLQISRSFWSRPSFEGPIPFLNSRFRIFEIGFSRNCFEICRFRFRTSGILVS